jgi:hypothetical protein
MSSKDYPDVTLPYESRQPRSAVAVSTTPQELTLPGYTLLVDLVVPFWALPVDLIIDDFKCDTKANRLFLFELLTKAAEN